MAKFISSTFDKLSGRIGDHVAVISNGKSYLRKYTPPTDNKTEKQLAQRAKFALAMKTLKPFRPVIADTFGSGQAAYGKVMSLCMNSAITGSYPDYQVDWSKLVISPNLLPLPLIISDSGSTTEKLSIEWDRTCYGYASANDKVNLIIYDPTTGSFSYFKDIAARADGGLAFNPEGIADISNIKIWLLFVSAQKRNPSASWFYGG
jgi:hypothetical protein